MRIQKSILIYLCFLTLHNVRGSGEPTKHDDINVTESVMDALMKTNDRLEKLQQETQAENENLRQRLQALENVCLKGPTGMDTDSAHVAKRADDPLQSVVDNLAQTVTDMTARVTSLDNVLIQQQQTLIQTQVSVYVRWGNNACPNENEYIYSGFVGGSHSQTSGAAANYLCLPSEPAFDRQEPLDNLAQLYGGEYHTNLEATYLMDAVCVVCRVPRAASLMIPANTACPSGWTQEYTGHLMAGRPDHAAASEFICVDRALVTRPNSAAATDGKLLYYTKTVCGTLPCPPYQGGKIVPCVVCTK